MTKSIKYRLLIIFLFSVSCAINKPKSIFNFDYTIIPFSNNETGFLFKNSKPATLSAEEILLAENIVGNEIQKIIDRYNNGEKYVRQYIAVENSNGEKEIYIQCMTASMIEGISDWKSYFIDVADGGPDIIRVTVNLTKKAFYNLGIGTYG